MTAGHRTPLKGRYLVRNPLLHGALRASDILASLFRGVQRRVPRTAPPRRVLIAVGGHLGDAVIATSVFPVLRGAQSNLEIGVLAPSWCRPVLAGHPMVRWFHEVDHWKLSRSGDSLPSRWRRHRASARAALREVRSLGYDAAVDLYPFYPNAAWLLWRAGIAERTGFTSGGWAPLYTTAVRWTDGGRHTAERHLELLAAAGLCPDPMAALRYDLPPLDEGAVASSGALLRAHDVPFRDYIVLHMGSGSPQKDWPAPRWQNVAAALAAAGHRLVFTGTEGSEAARASSIAAAVPGAISVAGGLRWEEFRAVLAGARVVVSVDTVAAHLAAASGRPVVVIMAPVSDPAHWRPLGPATTILDQAEITEAAVLAAVRGHLEEKRS